jgi:hypothetical protein
LFIYFGYFFKNSILIINYLFFIFFFDFNYFYFCFYFEELHGQISKNLTIHTDPLSGTKEIPSVFSLSLDWNESLPERKKDKRFYFLFLIIYFLCIFYSFLF